MRTINLVEDRRGNIAVLETIIITEDKEKNRKAMKILETKFINLITESEGHKLTDAEKENYLNEGIYHKNGNKLYILHGGN